MKQVAQNFSIGFLAPFRGMGLCFQRDVRLWAVLPFVLTFFIFVAGLSLGWTPVMSLAPWASGIALGFFGVLQGGWLFALLNGLLLLVLWPLSFIIFVYSLYLVSKVIAAPLYSLLAEAVLRKGGLLPESPFQLGHWVRASTRLFWISLLKALLFLGVGVVLFVLSLIPVVGFFAALGFLLIASFDITDYSLEALQWGLRERLRFFFTQFPVFFGLALALGLVFLIPGLSFLLLPAAIAGAADMVRRLKGENGQRHDS